MIGNNLNTIQSQRSETMIRFINFVGNYLPLQTLIVKEKQAGRLGIDVEDIDADANVDILSRIIADWSDEYRSLQTCHSLTNYGNSSRERLYDIIPIE